MDPSALRILLVRWFFPDKARRDMLEERGTICTLTRRTLCSYGRGVMTPTHFMFPPTSGGEVLTAIYIPLNIGLKSIELIDDREKTYHIWSSEFDKIDIQTILKRHEILDIETILRRCNYLPPTAPNSLDLDIYIPPTIDHSFDDLITIDDEVYKRVHFDDYPIPIVTGMVCTCKSGEEPLLYHKKRCVGMMIHTVFPPPDNCWFYAETLQFRDPHQDFPAEVKAQFPSFMKYIYEMQGIGS